MPYLSGVVDAAMDVASTIGISHSEVHLLEYLQLYISFVLFLDMNDV